jgi:hypothetical protein
MRTGDGRPIPPLLRAEVNRLRRRLVTTLEMIREVEAERELELQTQDFHVKMKLGSGRRTRSRADWRDQAIGAARPQDCVGLYFRCNLSGRRKRLVLPSCDSEAPASRGNLDRGRARRAYHPSPRSGGMACFEEASHPGQHHALAFSAEIARAPGREHLAIHARQSALKPHLQISQRHFGHCCFAWNKLIDMPWKIISIGIRDWAYRS